MGPRIHRKLVAFYVDDWGSVRIRGKEALDILRAQGIDTQGYRFSHYDSLESAEDLAALFETLRSVRDKNGRPACFTAVTNPCNPDFDAIRANGMTEFVSEPFVRTLEKYGYDDVPRLWTEGIAENIFRPIFHGTEHISRNYWMKALRSRNYPDIAAFACDSVGVPGSWDSVMQPYYIESPAENATLAANLAYGLDVFENTFGFRSRQFKAGGDVVSPDLYPTLMALGVEYIDETFYVRRSMGDGRYRRSINFTGKRLSTGQRLIVRNCVFEPTAVPGFDSVAKCMSMIDIAFACRKPAIISSHRVNFVGSIDEGNRQHGLEKLGLLLREIVKRYPEVEFVSGDQLTEIIF